MSDALGDVFFEIFDVFLVDFFFFSKLITLHGPTAAKKTVALKRPYFAPFPGKIIRRKKQNKKTSCPRRRWTPESPKPFGRPPHCILPLFPTSPPSAAPSPRYCCCLHINRSGLNHVVVVVVVVFTLKTVLTSIQYPSLSYSSRQRNEFPWSHANPK